MFFVSSGHDVNTEHHDLHQEVIEAPVIPPPDVTSVSVAVDEPVKTEELVVAPVDTPSPHPAEEQPVMPAADSHSEAKERQKTEHEEPACTEVAAAPEVEQSAGAKGMYSYSNYSTF